jgi:hypothetical protein
MSSAGFEWKTGKNSSIDLRANRISQKLGNERGKHAKMIMCRMIPPSLQISAFMKTKYLAGQHGFTWIP